MSGRYLFSGDCIKTGDFLSLILSKYALDESAIYLILGGCAIWSGCLRMGIVARGLRLVLGSRGAGRLPEPL